MTYSIDVVAGECGLAGEIRSPPRLAARLAAAEQLGFRRAITAAAAASALRGQGQVSGSAKSSGGGSGNELKVGKMKVIPLRTLPEALRAVFGDLSKLRKQTSSGSYRPPRGPSHGGPTPYVGLEVDVDTADLVADIVGAVTDTVATTVSSVVD